jgi:hypothetical protein
MMMKRRHIFEFSDIPWWPETLRALLTDLLQTLTEKTQPFSPRVSLIALALHATGQTRVVDLCSGSAGPWLHLQAQLQQACGHPIEVLLTDKFPNASAQLKVASIEGLGYHPAAVDALAVSPSLGGVRTLFDGLHHFHPDAAEAIIRDAIEHRQAIVVFELLQRTWRDALMALLSPLMVLLITPLVRPRSLTRFLLTYVIPAAPLLVTWDGLVSMLRCYTAAELEVMAQRAGGKHYQWHIGTYRHHSLPVTYMVGYPRAAG